MRRLSWHIKGFSLFKRDVLRKGNEFEGVRVFVPNIFFFPISLSIFARIPSLKHFINLGKCSNSLFSVRDLETLNGHQATLAKRNSLHADKLAIYISPKLTVASTPVRSFSE